MRLIELAILLTYPMVHTLNSSTYLSLFCQNKSTGINIMDTAFIKSLYPKDWEYFEDALRMCLGNVSDEEIARAVLDANTDDSSEDIYPW